MAGTNVTASVVSQQRFPRSMIEQLSLKGRDLAAPLLAPIEARALAPEVKGSRSIAYSAIDSIASTSSAGSAISKPARSCRMCSALEVPVSGKIPTARANANTA